MQAKKRVLWVEDSARFELANVLGPVYASHQYDLTLAQNATTAADYLARRQFDAIIVDIRLPPGTNDYWREIFQNAGSDRTNAKLGLALLGWLLDRDAAQANEGKGKDKGKGKNKRKRKNGSPAPKRPAWTVAPEHIGVFSAEGPGEIGGDLSSMGVTIQREKRPGVPDTVLLDILQELLHQPDNFIDNPDASSLE